MRTLLPILLLFFKSLTSFAETPAYYDFTLGELTLPFVMTDQGTYKATLHIDPDTVDAAPHFFDITHAETVSAALETSQAPHFSFKTGVLNLPYITSQNGNYTAVMELSPSLKQNATLRFKLSNISPYIAPRANIAYNCSIFPADNVWNTPINTLPVHERSAAWVNAIGSEKNIRADFGSGEWDGGKIGIPYNSIAGSAVGKSPVTLSYHDESDAGPYPIPANYKIEAGSDRHLLTLDTETCQLFELYNAAPGNGWRADSGAIWNLSSNQLRPAGWTSADAAGLPIFPGLIRYDEVASGFISHAIRFTVPSSNSYIWPARHLTAGMEKVVTDKPPFGARFRLKATVDISGFDPQLQVILKAMQTYGIITADNGSSWFISGEPDDRWDDLVLKKLQTLKGSDFEAVETTCMMVHPNSGQADLSQCQ